ncbi:hypothetical protein P5673_029662, partial [Acropora cervicornis]
MSQSSVAGIIANQTPSRAGGLQDSLHEWNHVRPRCDFRSASRLSNGPLMHPYLNILLSGGLWWNSKIAKKANSSLAFVKRKLFACSEETICIACQATFR